MGLRLGFGHRHFDHSAFTRQNLNLTKQEAQDGEKSEEEKGSQVFEKGPVNRGQRNAKIQEGQGEDGKEGTRRKGQKPKAGNCHRA